jgi:hypothetical protein
MYQITPADLQTLRSGLEKLLEQSKMTTRLLSGLLQLVQVQSVTRVDHEAWRGDDSIDVGSYDPLELPDDRSPS